ncbi:hypothetical protein Pyn_05647 [Prunus yedoensis var. nudiflora]|uniref:Uncharacterized protein n=1 Tax=Prunus yedoensis var. nudiflora TaxID=2094558 RepID=A0A314YEL5_PRUYE|nr:hypothetical protein Pyn_05647 [Prunus yedoensis var. nudiflora]
MGQIGSTNLGQGMKVAHFEFGEQTLYDLCQSGRIETNINSNSASAEPSRNLEVGTRKLPCQLQLLAFYLCKEEEAGADIPRQSENSMELVGNPRHGNRRKHSTSNWLRFVLWLAYLSADWLATLSLSVLSSSSTQEDGNSKD